MGRPIRPEWQFYVSPALGRRGGGKPSLEFRRARSAICAGIEPSTDRLRRTRTIFDGCPCRKSNPDILMVLMNEITAAYPATAIHVVLNNLNTHEPKEQVQRDIAPCGGSTPPAPASRFGLGGVFSPGPKSSTLPRVKIAFRGFVTCPAGPLEYAHLTTVSLHRAR